VFKLPEDPDESDDDPVLNELDDPPLATELPPLVLEKNEPPALPD